MLRAVIWDVDGTLAETERDGHRVAFNRAFDVHGIDRQWDVATYGRLLEVAGGYERLLHDLAATQPQSKASERVLLARALHATKNSVYAELVRAGDIALRAGVRRLLDEVAQAGVTQAIATTTSRANVEALLGKAIGDRWATRFAAVVCAEDARAKKPDPLAYSIALERLGIAACDAVAIEDSPNGALAACACGIATLVTRSAYFREADFQDVQAVCDDLDSPVGSSFGVAPRVDVPTLHRIVEWKAISDR